MNKEYLAYIHSDKWKAVRQRYFQSKLPKKCYVCHQTDISLDIHHKTYKRFGHEFLRDLIPLCRNCHNLTHEYCKRFPKQGLWSAARKLKQKLGLRKRENRLLANGEYTKVATTRTEKLSKKWLPQNKRKSIYLIKSNKNTANNSRANKVASMTNT